MRHSVPELDPGRWREIGLAMPAGAAYVALAAAAHWLERSIPLSRTGQVAYWTLAALLAGRYLLWARIPASPSLPADLPYLLGGLAGVVGLGALEPAVPTLFFYLAAIEGGVVFVRPVHRRLWIAGVAVVAMFVGLGHLPVRTVLVAWVHTTPVYLIIGVACELLHAGDRQRVVAEQLAEELAEANQRLEDYLVKAEALAVAEERARMAREIHDTLGHDLTKLDIQLELAKRLPADRETERETALLESGRLAKAALRDLRSAVQALRETPDQEFALPEALAGLAEDFRRQSGLPLSCHHAVSENAGPLPRAAALCLYRAAQEGLTNVVKHAHATKVTLALEMDSRRATLVVADDGRGSSGETGFGLRGVAERAEKLGGTLVAGTRPEGGFELKVSLPC